MKQTDNIMFHELPVEMEIYWTIHSMQFASQVQ